MTTRRDQMTARVVSLHSPEASDAGVGGTIAERIAMVSALSAELWARTGRPFPRYTRATLPIAITPLQSASHPA